MPKNISGTCRKPFPVLAPVSVGGKFRAVELRPAVPGRTAKGAPESFRGTGKVADRMSPSKFPRPLIMTRKITCLFGENLAEGVRFHPLATNRGDFHSVKKWREDFRFDGRTDYDKISYNR